MKKPIKALKFFFSTLLIVSLFIACDRDFANIDSAVLSEENANFSSNDTTLPIAAYNKKLEGLQVNNLASNLLGFFYDPSFGNTTASIVTQLVPSTFNPTFGENPVIDSVVINIPYYSSVIGAAENGNSLYKLDSVYGNRNAEIKLSVYQNNYFLRDFDPSGGGATSVQNYYSNAYSGLNSARTKTTTINFDDHMGDLIITDTILPSSSATVIVQRTETDTTTTINAPSYRVSLTSNESKVFWKNTIIDKEGDAVLRNENNFKNYFRGLYLKAETIENDGQMVLLNLASTNSNVTIYYTYGEVDSRLQSTYTLNFSGNTLNTFINDFSVTPDNGNPTEGDATLFIKGQAGSMVVVDLFPNNSLDNFKNQFTDGDVPTRLINDAYLEIYEDMSKAVNGDYGSKYHKYDRIYAYDIENNAPVVDYDFDQSTNTQSPFSSKFISLGLRDTISGRYKIRLTEHLKNILLRDSTNTKIGLVLSNNVNYTSNAEILNSDDGALTNVPAATIITPRGTVLYGSNESVDEDLRLKLKVFYTEPK